MHEDCQDRHPPSSQTPALSPPRRMGVSFSWWYRLLIGYGGAIAFAAIATMIPWIERLWGIQDYFTQTPFVIAVMLVAWFWGLGPALLALLLEILALDYWFIPPAGEITFFLWPDIGAFAPFLLIQLIVVRMILLQKSYRRQLLRAQQVATQRAEALAESNDALDRANRFKEYFLSLTSHELRAPLTLIRGQAQLALHRLARRAPLPTEVAFLPVHLEKITVHTRRLEVLASDLLNFSSLRSGTIPLHRSRCDLGQLCREVVEDQRASTGRAIDLMVPAEPVMLHADAGRLSQVVTNLLTNAIKYSPASFPIKAGVEQGDEIGLVKVYNDGPAISKDQQDKIFEPLYRTPEAQASEIAGWGLGLAVSKEIVEQHAGRIWVESAAGEGTTFGVELPLQSDVQNSQIPTR